MWLIHMAKFLALCPDLTPPSNGAVDQSGNSAGDTGTFTCDEGYQLVGAPVLMCLDTGMWNDTSPVCTALQGMFIQDQTLCT